MKERFLGTREVVVNTAKRLDKFLAKMFDFPIPYEVAITQLEHKPSCSRSTSLIRSEQDDFINMHDGGTWGINTHPIPIKQKIVECKECHATKRYTG